MFISIGEAAALVGVSTSTMRRWERNKKINSDFRTPGAHRRFNVVRLKEMFGMSSANAEKSKTIAYARVSSHDQKMDLGRQEKRLKKYCRQQKSSFELISDLGSGLNYKKRGLKRLIKLILLGKVSRIVLTHKDRLLRFGSEIIFTVCQFLGIHVEIIEESETLDDEQRLAKDVLEIITVFSARLYGKRAHQKK